MSVRLTSATLCYKMMRVAESTQNEIHFTLCYPQKLLTMSSVFETLDVVNPFSKEIS